MDNATITALNLREHVRTHPYQTLLVAAGVGYVLGGGLFTRLTFRALRIGARMGAIPTVQRGLLLVAAAALSPKTNASS